MRTLIAYSGGLDTAYLAYKFLTETEDEITLVYIDSSMLQKNDDNAGFIVFNNNRNSGKNRFIADRTSKWLLKNTRPFNMITKTVKEVLSDESLNVYFARYAAKLMNENLYDRACGGWNWDIFPDEAFEDNLPRHPQVIATERAFAEVSKRGEFFWPLIDHMFDYRQGNVHALAYLPKELLKLSIGCENIVLDLEEEKVYTCGHCNKCNWREFCEKKLSEGWTPDQVQEYRLKRSKEFVPGKWSPMRTWIQEELGKKSKIGKIDQIKEGIEKKPHWGTSFFEDKGIWEGLVKF
jgi:7-cyano-7-deazaguanine synthase in queuosine biosynthesis